MGMDGRSGTACDTGKRNEDGVSWGGRAPKRARSQGISERPTYSSRTPCFSLVLKSLHAAEICVRLAILPPLSVDDMTTSTTDATLPLSQPHLNAALSPRVPSLNRPR